MQNPKRRKLSSIALQQAIHCDLCPDCGRGLCSVVHAFVWGRKSTKHIKYHCAQKKRMIAECRAVGVEVYELPEEVRQVAEVAWEQNATLRASLELGEWIAKRLVENPKLFKQMPPMVYSYYQIWLDCCRNGHRSKIYEQYFAARLERVVAEPKKTV